MRYHDIQIPSSAPANYAGSMDSTANAMFPHVLTSYGHVFPTVNVSDHAHVQLGDIYSGTGDVQGQYQQFLQTLCFPELFQRQESITQAHVGTFEWIFSSDPDEAHMTLPFEPWMVSETHNLYWVAGKAGSGKSTLLEFLGGHDRCSIALRKWAYPKQLLLLKHFFWERGSPMQRNFQGFLRSLLWQFFVLSEQEDGLRLWKQTPNLSQAHAKSSQLLTRTLETVLSLPSLRFCLFIDGLDECSDQDDVLRLLQRFQNLKSVKVCISSRPERKFEIAFSPTPSRPVHVLHLDKMTHADMQKFAQDELLSAYARGVPGLIQEEQIMRLLPRLLTKAQGVFRWLSVAVSSLKEGIEYEDEWEALVERLQEMPGDVFQLYIQMVARSEDNLKRYASSAASILKYLLHTGEDERLTLPGLAWALNAPLRKQVFESDVSYNTLNTLCGRLNLDALKVRIPSHCASLVEIRTENTELRRSNIADMTEPTASYLTHMLQSEQPVVYFIHSTVREFLADTPEGRQLTVSCAQNSNDIKNSFLQSDLILLLCHACGTKQSAKYNQINLRQHLEPIIDMEHYYNHWKLIEGCTAKVLRPSYSDMWYVNYLWISRYERPKLPPSCEDGWLYWCICNNYFFYVKSAMSDPKRPRSAATHSRLLCVIIRSCVLGIPGYQIVTAADAERIMDNVRCILAAGISLDSSVGIMGHTPLHRWAQRFSVLSYCLYMMSFSSTEAINLHTLQDIALLLLKAGATFTIFPLPLQEIFLHPHLRSLGDDEVFCLIRHWDPLAKTAKHINHCCDNDCTVTSTSLISQMEGLENSAESNSQLLILYFDDQRLYKIRRDDQRTLLDLLDMHLDVLESVAHGQSEYYQQYPSIIEVPFYYLNYLGQERLDGILERGSLISKFDNALRILGWSEEDISVMLNDPELRHRHATDNPGALAGDGAISKANDIVP